MFSDLIDQKYRILGKTAQSESDLRSAQAGQIRGATALAPGEAAAREAQAFGTAGAETGLGGYYSALGGATTARVPSEIGLTSAQTGLAGAQTSESAARTSAIPGLTNWLQGSGVNNNSGGNFAMGTSRINAMNGQTSVPGKMPPKGQNTDVTPANLTPGEAVLNRGAAEHLGRDVIDVLNAIGNIKMQGDKGAVSTDGPATKAPTDSENGVKGYCMGGVPGYASGSSGTGTVGGGQGSGIDPIAGQGGTWGPEPKFDPRAAAGIRGVPRPIPLADGMSDVPEPGAAVGYADGTSEVMARTHADAARNAQAGSPYGEVSSFKSPGPDSMEDRYAQNSRVLGPAIKGNYNAGEENAKIKQIQAGKPMTQGAGGYAKGVAKVPGKAKAASKGASKITPEMLQQIMALSKGGGGMIPPGQGAPMPMAMPQVAPGGGMGG